MGVGDRRLIGGEWNTFSLIFFSVFYSYYPLDCLNDFQVPINDPIEPSLQLKFERERLRRTIKECNDINTLRAIAMELLELNQKKSAIADWATKRAAEA